MNAASRPTSSTSCRPTTTAPSPRRDDELAVAFGWQDEGLVDKGLFTVDEVQHSGTPDRLTLRARSADLRGELPGEHFDATPWLITEVEHSLGDSGFGTRVQCEVQGATPSDQG